MAMRPMVARVETITEFAGINFAEDSRRPFSEMVRWVEVIWVIKFDAGRSTSVAQGMPPPQYSSKSDFGVPPLSTRNRLVSHQKIQAERSDCSPLPPDTSLRSGYSLRSRRSSPLARLDRAQAGSPPSFRGRVGGAGTRKSRYEPVAGRSFQSRGAGRRGRSRR